MQRVKNSIPSKGISIYKGSSEKEPGTNFYQFKFFKNDQTNRLVTLEIL